MMQEFVIPPADQPFVPVIGTQAVYPVRRIFCVGRNYGKHVVEMGGDPKRDLPIFFTKPADAVVRSGTAIPFPKATHDLHHEVELVVAMGKLLENADAEMAARAVYGLAVGVDLTRRDLQAKAKKAGAPWDTAKAFDQSAPISAIRPVASLPDPLHGEIRLQVNGSVRQQADLSEMIWSVPELLAHLSGLFTLLPGDLVFTGTPDGVGPLQAGDQVSCKIAGICELEFQLLA